MDIQDLRRAYAEFVAAAADGGPFARPDDGAWSAEMVLAHIIVGDRLIAEAAGRIMADGVARFDNRAALSEPYLHAVIEAAGGWHGLVEAVERGGGELMALAERMTDAQGSTPIPAQIVSDGRLVLDETVPVSRLVRGPADIHLRLHMQQLAELARVTSEAR